MDISFRMCRAHAFFAAVWVLVAAMAFGLPAHASSFASTPMRTIGPHTSGQAGSWMAADDRSVGPTVTGQDGWSSGPSCNASLIDQAVSHAAAHSGTQSLRISNWYTSPCVDSIVSPAFAAVGEAGSKTAGNTPAATNTVTYDFWFRSASTDPDPGMSFTTQLSALASYRLSYLSFNDGADGSCPSATGLHLKTVGIEAGTGSNAVSFTHHCSPTLVRGDWYHVLIHGTFNAGSLNDVIETKVFDSNGASVWDDTSNSWEYGYYIGLFNGHVGNPPPVQGPFAADHVSFDVSHSTGPGPTGEYASAASQGTQGIYVDDLNVVPGAGTGYATTFDGNRYVAVTGNDGSNDCTDPAAPCVTIAHALAVANAYDTIHVGSGTYAVAVNTYLQIDSAQEGVRVLGDTSGSMPIITRQGGSANLPLLLVNGARNVHVAHIQFNMDQSFVAEGILASGFVDGLDIDNNHFVNSQSVSGVSAGFGYRNAISINDVRNSLGNGRTNGSSVSITNNVIDGITDAVNGAFLRAGVNMDAGVGTISGNTITTGTQDIHVRFATTTSQSSQKDLVIDGNTLNGRGLEFDSPNASVGQITISNNHIHALAGIDGVTPYPADYSLVRLIDNTAGMPTTVVGNTFSGFTGAYRGVLIENYPGINLTGNTFTPAANATTFRSLVISNKGITSVNPALAPLAMSMTATGNTFDGSGVANAGTAVELLDDNDANGAASFGNLIFGGSGVGQANQFDGNLRWYFHLDDVTCDTAGSTDCGLINYPGVGTIPDTQMRPFAGNVTATDNLFDGATPVSMDGSQQSALQARTNDKAANTALGNVDYGLTATGLITYVDGGFAGASYGDALTFTSSSAGCGATTVYFGVNAFATIPEGVSHVVDGGTVCVAAGSYSDAVTLTRPLSILGDGTATTIAAPVVISAIGTASTPLLLENLGVSNAAGNGVRVNNASYVTFNHVGFTSNGGNGLDFGGTADHVNIVDSNFNLNATFGIRTATGAVVSDVAISGTLFQYNLGGIVLFGASGSGSGQISNWTVDDSRFFSNAHDDNTIWGGGIWIKTGGSGSAINGFTVTNSDFDDNGSSKTLNQVGITIRARPNTTMSGVSICGNTFAETANPGTQLTGINVFDDTGNNGYQPAEVCSSNTFTGIAHSISGLEQHDLRGTQPVVNITGGSIANTEYINGLVTRVRDSAKFATIGLAMNDAATQDGDEIDVPTGIYRENVSISHNGITLKGAGAGTIIDGSGLSGSGVTIPNGKTGVTLQDFTVQDFTAIGTSGGACVFGSHGNDGTTIKNLGVANCAGGRGGIFLNGPVDNITIDNNDISATDGRGIVIWNGFKSHIAITDNDIHDLSGCCGIELQDGTASGVTVTGNTVENVGDSGMSFIGLTSGAGANLIDNNTIINTGRFGIAIKLPNGSGAETGDGSIMVSNNHVTRLAAPTSTDVRDVAGIIVIRRSLCGTCAETDTTTGVVVKGNTVTGWKPLTTSSNDGFGIVAEGSNSHVYGNTVSGSDIGIQVQAGNDGYPGDSNQAATNAFFSRGNAPTSCVDVGSNNFSGNGTDQRNVTMVGGNAAINAANLAGGVHNGSAYYCSIQAAVDAATAGDTITVEAGNYPENVRVTKSLTLDGPYATTAGYDASRDGTGEAIISPATGRALNIVASTVTFAGFTIQGVNDNAIVSGGNYSGATPGPFAYVNITNNRVLDVHNGSGVFTNGPYPAVADWQISGNLFSNIDSPIGSGINYWKADGGSVSDNHVEYIGFGGIQIVGSQNVAVTGNVINATGHSGVNVGGVGGHNDDGISITGNTLTDTNTSGNTLEGGLTFSAGASNVNFACNSVSGSGTNGFSAGTNATTATGLTLFDNAFDVGSDVSNNASQNLDVGSNWYGGGSGSVAGTNASGTQLAQALAASPIGNAACGDNTPVNLVAVSGGGQMTAIGAAFAQPLVARVTDGLGGAVSGQGVSFSAPASGPTASLGSASGSTNYNGEVSTTATANGLAGGPYNVIASSGSLTAVDFALTNGKGTGTVVFGTLNFTYDGTAHALTAQLQQEPTVTCTVSPANVTNAGSYSVSASCTGVNYVATGSASAVVAKAAGTVAFDSFTYTGSAQTTSAHIVEEPTSNCSVNPASVGPDAGSYAAIATCTGTNYDASDNGVVSIAKVATTVTITAADLQQEYGSTHAVGATASPAISGMIDVTYDGSASVPTQAGTYSVLATVNDPNYSGSASAVLTVSDAANVALTISGPDMALVGASAPYTDQLTFDATLGNSGAATSQKVHYEFQVVRIDDGNGSGGQPMAIDMADVQLCVNDASGWSAQEPNFHRNCPQDYESLFYSQAAGSWNGRPAVSFRYPVNPTNDFPLPTMSPAATLPTSLVQFKPGEYQVTATVVGDDDGRIYASAMADTTVPDAAIGYSGANTGPAEVGLLSTATLTNSGGRVDGKVIVRITLSDAAATDTAPITLASSDAELDYQLGGNYATLPWNTTAATNGGLVTYYGPSAGFDLEDGHNATTAGRGTFHREGSYHLLYEVVDVDTSVVYASDEQTINIGPNNVAFTLSDLTQTYDGSPRAISVAPANVPHTTVYASLGNASSCPATPASGSATAPTDADSYCVYVDASGNYQGSASGMLVVAKANVTVSIDGATAGEVDRIYNGSAQVVTATTPVTLSGTMDVRYNGNATAPTLAGTYALTASINDPNYTGSANGSLVVATASGTAIILDDNDGSVDNVIHRSFSGGAQAVTATTTPNVSYTLTYVGDGGTSYPLTQTAPSATGSYHVVATTTDPNYAAVTVSGTLVIEPIDVTVDSTGDTVGAVTVAGPPRYSMSATTTHVNGAGPSENVLAHVLISHVGGAQLSDVGIDYLSGVQENANCVAAPPSGFWCPLTLIDNGNGTLGGSFGPPTSGFPLTDGATSQFRTLYHRGGQYQVSVSLDGVNTGTSYVSSLGTVDVAELKLAQTTPTSASTGVAVDSSVTLSNTGTADISSASGTPNNENVLGQVIIGFDQGNLDNADLSVSYFDSSDNSYHALPLSQCADDASKLCGNFGPATTGFPVAAGYNATSLFRTSFVTPGNYDVTVRAVGASSGVRFADSTQAIAVQASNATITLGAGSLNQVYGATHAVTATTTPAGLAYSVTYDGDASVPTQAGDYTVVATITTPGYSGSTSSNLHINKAVATVSFDTGSLHALYDGNAHAATATTSPSGLTLDFTYSGGSAPINAGSTIVTATVNDANFSGSATAILIIDKAPTTVTISAADLQQTFGSTHAVGATAIPAISGTIDVTYDGSASVPTAIGSYTVVATVVDMNYVGSASATLVISAVDAPDLDVTITDGREYQQVGELLTYTIRVNNVGNTDVTAAHVSSILPATLEHADPSWTCLAAGTATCTASGSGDLQDNTVNIPVGGGVTYLFNAWVRDDQTLTTDLIQTTVTVTATGDINASNNAATDTTQAVIFRNGFELHGDGGQPAPGPVPYSSGALAGQDIAIINLDTTQVSHGQPIVIASLRAGSDHLLVEMTHVAGQTLVRMRGSSNGQRCLTAWTTISVGTQQLAIGQAVSKDDHRLLLVGGAHELSVPLSGNAKLSVKTVGQPK